MERSDAECAYENLQGTTIDGHKVRLAWGKPVSRPSRPLPLLPGQQYGGSARDEVSEDDPFKLGNSALPEYVVRPPIDLNRRRDINLLASLVATQGQLAEAIVIETELAKGESSQFQFLFNPELTNSDEWVYYRWRVYSISQGDDLFRWRTKPFAMYDGGPLWKPPSCANPRNTWDDALKDRPSRIDESGKVTRVKLLSSSDREALKVKLASLSCERTSIADAMIFCIQRSNAAAEICVCIVSSVLGENTQGAPPGGLDSKIAKLYLISDILYNAGLAHVKNSWAFRDQFEKQLEQVFCDIGNLYRSTYGLIAAKSIQARVERVLHAWDVWSVFDTDYMRKIRHVFLLGRDEKHSDPRMGVNFPEDSDELLAPALGATNHGREGVNVVGENHDENEVKVNRVDDDALDGDALNGDALDGDALDSDALDSDALDDEDLDGEALDGEELSGEAVNNEDLDCDVLDGVELHGGALEDNIMDSDVPEREDTIDLDVQSAPRDDHKPLVEEEK